MSQLVVQDQDGGEIAQQSSSMDIATSRSAQEVQAAMIVAKKFPRDEIDAIRRIKQACKRKKLAECSQYAYKRGNQMVTGPSIRLAEVMAQSWGNLDFGIIELSNDGKTSEVMAFCHDLETNVRQTKIFTVKHERHTKTGSYKLSDPRDVYEMVANNGARRLRACILGVIPQDVQEEAVETCNATMSGDASVPLADRARLMVEKFSEIGVTKEMIELRLGYELSAIQSIDIANLGKIFNSIRDGVSKREEWFEVVEKRAAKKDVAIPKPQPKKQVAIDKDSFVEALEACKTAEEAAQVEIPDGLSEEDGFWADDLKRTRIERLSK